MSGRTSSCPVSPLSVAVSAGVLASYAIVRLRFRSGPGPALLGREVWR